MALRIKHDATDQWRASIWTHVLLCQDDTAQQLVLETFHGDGEVDDGGLGTDLRSVGRVRQLGGDVQSEAIHHVYFFVSNFHLFGRRKGFKGLSGQGFLT